MDVGMSVQVVHKFCLFRKHLSVLRNRSFSHTGTKKIQLFRERLSEKVHARQSRKVLWVVLSALFFKEI